MANTLYPLAKQRMLSGSINFSTDTLKVVLLPDSYTYSASHEFLSNIGTVIGTAQTLVNKTVALGVFDADDVTFAALAAGSNIKAVVMFKDTGVAGTSLVIAYFDVVTGLPAATNGGDIQVQWDNGAFRILSL